MRRCGSGIWPLYHHRHHCFYRFCDIIPETWETTFLGRKPMLDTYKGRRKYFKESFSRGAGPVEKVAGKSFFEPIKTFFWVWVTYWQPGVYFPVNSSSASLRFSHQSWYKKLQSPSTCTHIHTRNVYKSMLPIAESKMSLSFTVESWLWWIHQLIWRRHHKISHCPSIKQPWWKRRGGCRCMNFQGKIKEKWVIFV